MADKQVDILIIGGGLTGASFMLALQGLGYSTLLVEAKPFSEKASSNFDARSLALSPASVCILNILGVWDFLKEHATAIEMIHVSDQHRFGMSRFEGNTQKPLGYVVEMSYISQALHHLLAPEQLIVPATLNSLDMAKQLATVTTVSGEINIAAQLIVAADGAHSVVRHWCNLPTTEKNYLQNAIVANIGLDKPHQHRAYERFTSQGPLALLPMQEKRMSLVWAMLPEQAERTMALDEQQFLQKLQAAFGYRLGRFTKVGQRSSYPLHQILMPQQVKWPVVFVGNAAHTLHPVAGQGFNLGIRDVATLAECIAKQGLNQQMLDSYVHLRSHDQQMISRFTDGLITLFTSRLPGASLARNIGLTALNHVPALKNLLSRYARGFGGYTPDLLCEIALKSGELE